MQIRRQDRAVTKDEALQYLKDASVGYLALAANNIPYVVPLNFILLNNHIYFHSAWQGRKIELLRNNPACVFAVSFLDGIKAGEGACAYGAYYRSALVTGVARFVVDPSEKLCALTALTEKHAVGTFAPVSLEGMEKTAVVAIEIVEINGKSRRS